MSRTSKKQEDFQVLVPLRKLLELLDNADKAMELSDEVTQLRNQLGALRGQFIELAEKLKELE